MNDIKERHKVDSRLGTFKFIRRLTPWNSLLEIKNIRRLIIHLVVAVLTFAVGIFASMLWGGFLAPSMQKVNNSVTSVSKAPMQETIVAPLRSRCGCALSEDKFKQEVSVSEHRHPISAGILNAKALSLPMPVYPAIARSVRASGTVVVQITVDERGCIESARAISGHPLLQAAATQAAEQACFSPTRLSGQPVKVTGVVTYNFTLQ